MMDQIEILKQMKAELLQRVDALDYAIRILEASIPAAEPTAKPKTKRKTKPAATPEPGDTLDMSKIPLYGGSSGGIRLD